MEKKIFLILSTLFLSLSFCFSQTEDEIVNQYLSIENENKSESEETKKSSYKYTKEKIYPSPKRPRKNENDVYIGKDEKTSSNEYVTECIETLKYGLEDSIITLIDEFTKNEDLRFVDQIYDLFRSVKSINLKNKILSYYAKLKDPCLEDYACEVINDPYDENKTTVDECFKYVIAVKCEDCVPGLVDLVDKEDETYFNGALNALGELGTTDEALFLSDFFDREDLSTPQKQSLMKVLGKIKAVETWEKLSQIAQDEDENTFLRMYAAQAIGAMQVSESEDILIKLFESTDPNLRCYVIKGLKYFDSEKTNNVILQALRDTQYKVRLEAVDVVNEKQLKEAMPFLIYRCKDKKEEKIVKEKTYGVIARMNLKEGNDYLISVLDDKKTSDATKIKVASVLLESNYCGTKEVIALAEDSFTSDLKKNLRYSLGKEFAKYGRSEFEDICRKYLESTDTATQGTGLDIWAKGKYKSLRPLIQDLAKDADYVPEPGNKTPTKIHDNAKKAKRILSQVDSIENHQAEKTSSPDSQKAPQSSAENNSPDAK